MSYNEFSAKANALAVRDGAVANRAVRQNLRARDARHAAAVLGAVQSHDAAGIHLFHAYAALHDPPRLDCYMACGKVLVDAPFCSCVANLLMPYLVSLTPRRRHIFKGLDLDLPQSLLLLGEHGNARLSR